MRALDRGKIERWCKPTQRGIRGVAGIDLNKARNRHVMDAVVGGVHAARRLHLAMCAYLILRDKVIKPLLAGVVRPFGRASKLQARSISTTSRLREEL